jgi:hypothetical protein
MRVFSAGCFAETVARPHRFSAFEPIAASPQTKLKRTALKNVSNVTTLIHQ